MKSSWDTYLARLKKPKVKEAFKKENKILDLGIALAHQRRRKGLTQEQVARKIGTSAPQVSRIERKPEHTNVRTLMRYAEAIGMTLDVKLITRR